MRRKQSMRKRLKNSFAMPELTAEQKAWLNQELEFFPRMAKAAERGGANFPDARRLATWPVHLAHLLTQIQSMGPDAKVGARVRQRNTRALLDQKVETESRHEPIIRAARGLLAVGEKRRGLASILSSQFHLTSRQINRILDRVGI